MKGVFFKTKIAGLHLEVLGLNKLDDYTFDGVVIEEAGTSFNIGGAYTFEYSEFEIKKEARTFDTGDYVKNLDKGSQLVIHVEYVEDDMFGGTVVITDKDHGVGYHGEWYIDEFVKVQLSISFV